MHPVACPDRGARRAIAGRQGAAIAMYSTCLRCDRALGRNTELPHLRVGRRVAFDTTTGRVWVICPACGQWNLVPAEERWEALAECDSVAQAAEARVSGVAVGLARTESGLELLRVGALPEEDIANWRYGRRVRVRERWTLATAVLLGVVALSVGVAAGVAFGAPLLAVWLAVFLGFWLLSVWRNPPRLWLRVPDGHGGRYLLWPWQIGEIRFVDGSAGGGPLLVLPHARGVAQLRGRDAVAVLGALLPTLNASVLAGADLLAALDEVRAAEEVAGRPPVRPGRGTRRRARQSGRALPVPGSRRPWECLVERLGLARVATASPPYRLALEMAVTEEQERLTMRTRAEALGTEWREEEKIGRIADDLLLPDAVVEKLSDLRAERDADR